MEITKLLDAISAIKPKYKTTLIAIDGRGGSGKTTLALLIKKHFLSVKIITTDDFYNKEIEKIDEKQLEEQILLPLSKNRAVTYMEFNGKETRSRTIEPGGILIIEGVYSIHNSIEKYYDLKIWVETSLEDVNKRVLTRDGHFSSDWDKFHRPKENKYIQEDKPQERADFVIDNSLDNEGISNLDKLWLAVTS